MESRTQEEVPLAIETVGSSSSTQPDLVKIPFNYSGEFSAEQNITILNVGVAINVPIVDFSGSITLNVAREAILLLKETIDFLGYQLSLANEMMTEEQFEEIADQYIYSCRLEDGELRERILALDYVLGGRLDAELASLALHCSAEKAIELISSDGGVLCRRPKLDP